jgi:hypothetical protein
LSAGGDLPAEVAQAHFDGTEDLAVGGIGQGVGHLLDQRQDLVKELLTEALAALSAGFIYLWGRGTVCLGAG